MWTSPVGILGRPRGAGWGSQCGTGPAEGRLAQDLARRAKIRGQDARIGHRVWRTWVGQSEATAGSRASPRRGPERACGGCLGACGEAACGREAGEAAAGIPAGSRRGALGRRAQGGRVRGLGGRPRQGAVRGPRGVSELGSRGAQTPPRCEPRLRGGGRPGPPSASHRRRHSLRGLPGPRNAAVVAGGALLERGRARSPRALPICLCSSSPGGRCWGNRWQAGAVGSLSLSLPLPVALRPPP